MTSRRPVDSQFDFFIPAIVDLKWRDQQDTMERPFFSLSKNKRMKPIEYRSVRDGLYVNVIPHQEYGMATIWDADILIWAASVICELQNKKHNEIPRTLQFMPYDLLKAIGRGTGGSHYQRLKEGLYRLRNTSIETNIRVPRGQKKANFSWISEITDLVDADKGESRGMSITLSDWFYEGILREGGVLSIDPLYFQITGGRERWLYRVARKHAGGAGGEGFAIGLPILYEKSGAEGTYRRFKFEIAKIVRENALPGFFLALENERAGEPLLRMTRRAMVTPDDAPPALPPTAAAKRTAKKPAASAPRLPLLQGTLPDTMIASIRRDFPGWDVYALQAEFDAWLRANPARQPDNYPAAFYGFVKRHQAKMGHTLR
jgi:plasmid replication initiation protein